MISGPAGSDDGRLGTPMTRPRSLELIEFEREGRQDLRVMVGSGCSGSA